MNDDDLINSYLKSAPSASAKKAENASSADDALINSYLNSAPASSSAPVSQTVAPPMSGYDKATSDILNAQPSTPIQPRSTSRMANDIAAAPAALARIPGNVGTAIKEDFSAGLGEIGSGVSDILQNRPATGVGRIGTGALSAVTSPVTGATRELVEKPITELTGSPEIGKRAGFVSGFALPVVKAGAKVSGSMPTQRAFSDLVDIVGRENLPEVVQRLRDNPRLSVMDVSPEARQTGQKLYVTEGMHQGTIEKFAKERGASAKSAVEGAYNETMGQTVDVKKKLEDLQNQARETGKTIINPALQNAKPVDITDALSYIDNKLKPGVSSILKPGEGMTSGDVNKALVIAKKYLTDGKSVVTDPQRLHDVQATLRSTASDMLKSSNGTDRQVGKALMDVRNKIVDAIDVASPRIINAKGEEVGAYREGLSKFRDDKQVAEAFQKGQDIAKTDLENRPEFFRDWLKGASPQDVQAAKEGVRVAVDQKINGMRFGARQGTDIPEIGFTKDKLEMLFGKDEAGKLFKRLKDEKDIADTNSKLIQNSQTAMRMKANRKVDLPVATKADLLPMAVAGTADVMSSGLPLASGALAAARLGGKGLDIVKTAAAKQKNAQLAKLLTVTSGPERDKLINQLSAAIQSPKPSMLQRLTDTGVKLIGP